MSKAFGLISLFALAVVATAAENVETIDANSSGFEHATHAADLDGDGKSESYVAADNQKEVRRYVWNGESFDRKVIAEIGASHLTWNLQDGVF